jgi:hypothetical protein
MRFAMAHFHYDRFDTPDDEQEGRYSVNFRTNPQGDVDQAVMSLDEAEVVFTRKPAAIDPKLLSLLPGTYETPNGLKVYVVANGISDLSIVVPGQPSVPLTLTKGLVFKTPQFSDLTFEFVVKDGQVQAMGDAPASAEKPRAKDRGD